MKEILRCEHLSIGYEGKAILKDLNFVVNEGDYYCIVGENGAGKSTLMKTLLGLLKEVEGKIYWQGEKAVGYLSQEKNIQADFPAVVEEVVLSGAQNRKGSFPFYRKKIKEEVKEKLERLGISSLTKKSFHSLSGGQRQRVLLARALMATDKLLLLDEPVTGLDPQATVEMYRIIEELNRRDGVTVIMISHDLEATKRYATTVMRLGESVFGEE